MGEMLTAPTLTDDASSIMGSVRALSSPSIPQQPFQQNPLRHRPPIHRYSSSPVGNHENGLNYTRRDSCTNHNLLAGFKFDRSAKPLFYLHDGSAITYGQFEQRIANYGLHLRRQYGVRKGDRVAAQVNKSPDSIALYLATLRVGAIYVPLNTDYKVEEIRYFLTNSAPCLFVCRTVDKGCYESLVRNINGCINNGLAKVTCSVVDEVELSESVPVRDLSIDQARSDQHQNGDCQDANDLIGMEMMDVDDLAAICYTSGTTGKPKGAMITHGNLLSNARALCETWMITEKDVLLHALPIYHVHGLFVAVNTILARGASLILLPRFDVDILVDWLPKASMMMGVPTYYTRLLQCPKLGSKCVETVRLFISGSAPLLENTWNEFKERTGQEILERYGMTEGQMVCSNPYEGKRKPGTVGRPLPLVTVRIRNGGLEYTGPNLFKGYWRMPDKTKEDFTEDGYFISGDLAELDEDGYVRILGRSKDLIITGGLNVYPKEVENVIDALPLVLESAVIGVPHPDFGEAVVAIVVLKDHLDCQESTSQLQQEITNVLKERIAGFKVPKRVYFQKQLPRNVMGKVQKNILRERYQHGFEN